MLIPSHYNVLAIFQYLLMSEGKAWSSGVKGGKCILDDVDKSETRRNMGRIKEKTGEESRGEWRRRRSRGNRKRR